MGTHPSTGTRKSFISIIHKTFMVMADNDDKMKIMVMMTEASVMLDYHTMLWITMTDWMDVIKKHFSPLLYG